MARKIKTHKPRTAGKRHVPDAYARKLRSSGRYRKFREWFMSGHPLCADPFGTHKAEGRVEPAAHLHHKRKVTEDPDGLCDEDNAMALCVACHARVEQ